MAQFDLRAASDAELVARFAAGRDQRAFAEVVRRHGPMVMGAARRVLRQEQDVEDAFQATFLALAAACERLRQKTALAAWLHQTALRTARSIGRTNAKWQRKIDRRTEVTEESYVIGPPSDQSAVLDEELRRLAPAYRAAILLCDLEGLSRTEAASRLSVPAGTLSARLTRGRRVLRDRLIRRGVTLSAGALIAAMKPTASAAAIMPTLIQETTAKAALFAAGKSASEIGVSTAIAKAAHGVITAMTVTKFSMIGAAALAIVFGLTTINGVGGLLSSFVKAGTIFRDTFDDGDAMDGTPISWTPIGQAAGTFEASSGDYILRPSPINDFGLVTVAGISELSLTDVSIRAQIRAESAFEGIGLLARGNVAPRTAYQGGIEADGSLYILENLEPAGTFAVLISTASDLRPIDEDILLQFDVFGDVLSLYAWRPSDARPDEPLLRVTSTRYAQGNIGLVYDPISPGLGSATFRFVQVADASIPEPSTAALSAIFFAGVFAWQWLRRW